MLLPAILGFVYISFGIIYDEGLLRFFVYEASWLSFAFLFVATANFSKRSLVETEKSLPRADLAVFLILTVVWVYSTTIVAINPFMAYYGSVRGFAAILVGLAAAALKRLHGERFTTSIIWALFAGAIFHAPSLIWVYVLEGQNPDFDWATRLPAYTNVRPYNHAVEAGLAAGIGLYFLAEHRKAQHQAILTLGTVLLWILLFWGGARGGFLALLAAFILMAVVIPQFFTRMWNFFLSTMALGASLSLLLPVPNDSFGLLGILKRSVARETLNQASSGRIEIWLDAVDIFFERPLFGHGLIQYRSLTDNLTPSTPHHVHNILLESLISFGLIGTVAIIYLIGKILIRSAFQLRTPQSDADIPMFFVATTLLAHGFISGTYFHMQSMITVAIALGLLLHTQLKRP